jgi:lactate dehydrogenase-like 2-hydroxyacid dehydrogenase
MNRYKAALLVTRAMPPNVQKRAELAFDLCMPGEQPMRDWLPVAVQHCDAMLCTPGLRVDSQLIGQMPEQLRVIGTFSVGYDHIDIDAAKARGIAVVNTPGVLSQATAEFTMALVLAAARRMGQAERLVRAGSWVGRNPADFLGVEVSGKRLGIFGMGRIGQCLARIGRAGFGMEVHYHNRTRLPPEQEQGAIYHADEASFLAASQVLCLMAPGGKATQGWLNAARIAALPPRCIVINTARGSLVDDAALSAALVSGHVAAAGLDVFPQEPRVPEVYRGIETVVLTPHIASATEETRDAMGMLVLDGIEAVLDGRVPPNLVR